MEREVQEVFRMLGKLDKVDVNDAKNKVALEN